MTKHQNALVVASPVSRALYKELLSAMSTIGPFQEDVKKTSIHLVHGSAFVGVRARKQYLLLTIKAENPLRSVRVFRAEQVSKNRWHLEVKLAAGKDIDDELLGWIGAAYHLSG